LKDTHNHEMLGGTFLRDISNKQLAQGENMSTSLLYHGFGLRGYDYLGTEYRAGAIWFKIEPKRERLKCSACGSENVIRRCITIRGLKALPISGKAAYLAAPMQRVEWRDCQVVRQIELGFAETRRTYTRAIEHPGQMGHDLLGLLGGETGLTGLFRTAVGAAQLVSGGPSGRILEDVTAARPASVGDVLLWSRPILPAWMALWA
jgi:hypothetical protein